MKEVYIETENTSPEDARTIYNFLHSMNPNETIAVLPDKFYSYARDDRRESNIVDEIDRLREIKAYNTIGALLEEYKEQLSGELELPWEDRWQRFIDILDEYGWI